MLKTAKKIWQPLGLSLLVLLALLLTACAPLPENRTRPTPTPGAITPTPVQAQQSLVYVSKDSANIWHIRRYSTMTRQSTNIYSTAAGQIGEVQVSADGQWILFLVNLSPSMRSEASANVQKVRINGQNLETLYTVKGANTVGALEWSPDQRYLAFREKLNVYLLDVAARTSHLVVPAQDYRGFVPRTWLDNTHLYLRPYQPSETPPLKLYVLDINTTKVQSVLDLPTLGGDFDSSVDGTTLFTCQYVFNMPMAAGPSTIEAQPALGGQARAIYRTADYAITSLRVATRTSLLFTIHNSGVSNVDRSHNGLWAINTNGSGLIRLLSETNDELTLFPASTQYVWSSISRNGNLYAAKVAHTTGPHAPAALLIGSLSGGTPTTVATGSTGTLEVAGWTQVP